MDYLSLRRREFETTLKVLRAYPEDKAQMKPAEKSRTAGELAMTLAGEERIISALIETGATNLNVWKTERPSSMAAIIATWEHAASENHAALAKLSSEDFGTIVDFYGTRMPLADALWLELLDHIHHRGQFSVYLRVVGAKVPSIYGPTAEVQWPSAD